jgi:methyl-accepting chemotaxis protein
MSQSPPPTTGLKTQAACESLKTLGPEGERAAKRLCKVAQEIAFFSPAEIYHYVDPDGLENKVEAEQVHPGAWVGIVRNILILLPLAATWVALNIATSSYATFLANFNQQHAHDSPLPQPPTFLELWQQGFNTSNPLDRFSTLAWFDVGCFGALMLLGFVIDFLPTWRFKRRAAVYTSLQEALEEQSERCLQEIKSGQSLKDRYAPIFAKATEVLQETSTISKEVTKQIKSVAKQMAAFQLTADTLANNVNTMHTQATKLTSAADRMAASTQLVAVAAGALQQNVLDLKASQDQMTGRIEDLTTEMRGSTDQARAATEVLTTTLTGFNETLGSTNTAMRDASSAMLTVGSTLTGIAGTLNQAAENMGNHAGTMSQAAQNLSDSAQTMAGQARLFTIEVSRQGTLHQETNGHLAALVQQGTSSSEKMAQTAGSLKTALEAQANTANAQAQATSGIAGASAQLHQTAGALDQTTGRLTEATGKLTETAVSLATIALRLTPAAQPAPKHGWLWRLFHRGKSKQTSQGANSSGQAGQAIHEADTLHGAARFYQPQHDPYAETVPPTAPPSPQAPAQPQSQPPMPSPKLSPEPVTLSRDELSAGSSASASKKPPAPRSADASADPSGGSPAQPPKQLPQEPA